MGSDRWTPIESATRAMHGSSRMTVNDTNDDPMMQEISGDMFHSDGRKGMEYVQNYGFSSRVKKRDGESGQPGGGKKGPAAEAIIVYQGGNRNHPIVAGIDDRRHRVRNLERGENIQYDDQGQEFFNKRDASIHGSPKKAVLRHAKYEQENQQSQGQQSSGTSASKKKGRDLKKQPKVTAEVICEENKILFNIGGKTVVQIDSKGFAQVGKAWLGLDNIRDRPNTKADITDGQPAKQVYLKK